MGQMGLCEEANVHRFLSTQQEHLPPGEDTSVPWNEVAVDLIGPWTVENTSTIQISALMCINICTTLTEIVRIEHKTAKHVADKFEMA